MRVEHNRLLIVLVCLIIRISNIDALTKREQCYDFAGDLSNCQRFVRCFHNLRVLFTCPSGTAYVPELQTCVGRELVTDCNDTQKRIDIITNFNDISDGKDDYPTIEADFDALEAPLQKSLSSHFSISIASRRFGCSSYCHNDGVCVLVGQSITCRCRSGFIGVRCQVSQNALDTRQAPCALPCSNGGVCVVIPNFGEICNCTAGFTGDLCDIPDTTPIPTTTPPSNGTVIGQPCPSNPCQFGGLCFTVPGGGFRCICVPGYTGILCSEPTTGTGTGGCGTNNACSNAGSCVPTTGGYQCQCNSGYAGNSCQINTALSTRNQCIPNPCLNGGSCYLTQNDFACICPTGYAGKCCDTTATNSNPCLNNPCQNTGTCQVVGTNTYRCICPVGLQGIRCEQRICDPNPCLYGGVCLPYGNSFQCQCPPQYTGRCCELLVVTTAPTNPCTSQPCRNGGTCAPTSATDFVCTCTPSYYGRCCEVRNYCYPNPCYNNGACIATATAYICQCTYPFVGSNCESMASTRATPQQTCPCVLCPCPTPAPAPSNPCLPNPCQNSGGCSVVQNTPQCHCAPSFTGYFCEYHRKRSLTNSHCENITCLNGGKCYEDEHGPKCACSKPYFGERCEQMNRPRTCNPNPCHAEGQCISTKDGYQCLCKNGRTGILCEEMILPKNYRWCPIVCRAGTTCVYEGTTPKCRAV